jgi:hypothetical protein
MTPRKIAMTPRKMAILSEALSQKSSEDGLE